MDSSKSAYLKCKYVGITLLSDAFLLLFKDYKGKYYLDGVFRRDYVFAGDDETSKLLKIIVNGENPDGTANITMPYYDSFGNLVPSSQKVMRNQILYENEVQAGTIK